ncbi:MAG: hypothetical protein ACRYFX_12890 [Janthinobacterium lividum]
MTEAQAQAATAVYGQLLAARQELARLGDVRPLLSGISLHAPGIAPVRVEGVQAQALQCAADLAEQRLRARVQELENQLAQL